jgi:hypothetical protein
MLIEIFNLKIKTPFPSRKMLHKKFLTKIHSTIRKTGIVNVATQNAQIRHTAIIIPVHYNLH